MICFAFVGITYCGSASLKLCACDACYPWSQTPSPHSGMFLGFCAIGCLYLLGLLLALRSHDQFEASHWKGPRKKKKEKFFYPTPKKMLDRKKNIGPPKKWTITKKNYIYPLSVFSLHGNGDPIRIGQEIQCLHSSP